MFFIIFLAKVIEEKEKDKAKKGPGKHLVAAMQERLKAIREEEEKQKVFIFIIKLNNIIF